MQSDAPHSAVLIVELSRIAAFALLDWSGRLLPLLIAVADNLYWQDGRDEDASETLRITGAVEMNENVDSGAPLSLCHLVLDGSLPWVVGQNFTD